MDKMAYCDDCWNAENDAAPVRVAMNKGRIVEICDGCGERTYSGIYVEQEEGPEPSDSDRFPPEAMGEHDPRL